MKKCQVCKEPKKSIPYTCPKCKINYCNLTCYRNHSNTCTEHFYQDRALDASRNAHKNKDQIKHMNEILQKEAREWNFTNDNNEEEEDNIEEMYDKLTLENGIDNTQEVLDSMFPSLRQEFESSIQDGSLQASIMKWNPWWIHTLDDEESFFNVETNLDEQLLTIPHFTKLPQRRPTNSLPPPLQYNVLSILYSSILTLRLYYGEDNCRDEIHDSVHTFLSTSAVLSHDTKYFSLEKVLFSLKKETILYHKMKCCYTPLHVLFQDLIIITSNVRYICKALLFFHELLCEMKGNKMKRHAKKLMFYISWCKTHWKEICFDCGLSDDMRLWIDENVPENGEGKIMI